jgi:cellulose synthase/poly-beta-1,6-N-acetylglucosamine synthase-like glycosyltransferase
VLAIFAIRRLVFLVATMSPPPRRPSTWAPTPSMLVILPARNEAAQLPHALAALSRLEYPVSRLEIVLVDDASVDGTWEVMTAFAATRGHVEVVRLREPTGKVGALAAGLAGSASADLIAVCDADRAFRPDSLRKLATAFADPTVGAACGYLLPTNADRTVVARYAAVETWVHQLVTSAGKDRLDLNPPMLGGGSVYRREALDAIGGFCEQALAEDLASTVALTRAGWRTRFLEDAVVENLMPEAPSEYWHQHVRWARGVLAVAKPTTARGEVPRARRLENIVVAGGYLDRIGLLLAVALARARVLSLWVPAAYLALTGAEVVAAVRRSGAGSRTAWFLVATAVCFPLDVAASAVAAIGHLARRPLVWRSPRGGGAASS